MHNERCKSKTGALDAKTPARRHNVRRGRSRKNGKFSDEKRVLREMKIATLNVQATLDARRLYQLESGCQNRGIDVVAVQEHRLRIESSDDTKKVDEIILNNGGSFMFASGKKKGQGRVGLYLIKKASNRLLFVEIISQRILIAHLEAKPNISLIAAYGPTNCVVGDEADADREEFLSKT